MLNEEENRVRGKRCGSRLVVVCPRRAGRPRLAWTIPQCRDVQCILDDDQVQADQRSVGADATVREACRRKMVVPLVVGGI